MIRRALLLAPSRGIGGGIERYAETLEWALATKDIECDRINLYDSPGRGSPVAYASLLSESRRRLRSSAMPSRVVVVHRALLPVASLAARGGLGSGISVICHGNDVWGTRHHARRSIENHLMARTNVRVVAVSNYTAGALSSQCRAAVLSPGLSGEWFRLLVEESAPGETMRQEIRLMTAFRLESWRDKGLPELLEAVAILRRHDIRVVVCGSGEPSPELRRLLGKHRHCTLKVGLTDRQLARELAASDLFVLATRTRPGSHPSGEGFGLVLLEAQVAGTPVIGPAYGGSHEAYVERVTGITPVNETVEALAEVLREMLNDRLRLTDMGKNAAAWARERFAPERYAAYAASTLL
jgi:phosphatidylinositol alpha-1,6-mannosyltransferase